MSTFVPSTSSVPTGSALFPFPSSASSSSFTAPPKSSSPPSFHSSSSLSSYSGILNVQPLEVILGNIDSRLSSQQRQIDSLKNEVEFHRVRRQEYQELITQVSEMRQQMIQTNEIQTNLKFS
jgi:hypothetical protein